MPDNGKVDEIRGRVREAYGDLTDNKTEKQKGTIDKMAGKVKQSIEHGREKLHDVLNRQDKAR